MQPKLSVILNINLSKLKLFNFNLITIIVYKLNSSKFVYNDSVVFYIIGQSQSSNY